MFDANACAIELLKMKSSEEFKKEVAATSAASTVEPEPAPVLTLLKPPDLSSITATLPVPPVTEASPISNSQESNVLSLESGDKPTLSVVPSRNSNGSASNGVELMGTIQVTPEVPVLVFAKKSLPSKPPTTESPASTTQVTIRKQTNNVKQTETSSVSSVKPPEQVPSTSSMAPNLSGTSSSATLNHNQNSTTGLTVRNEDEDALMVDSSSDEEEFAFSNQFSRDNTGSDNNEPTAELVIKRNSEYLMQRCASLMQRLQGIMQGTAAKHVSRQLKGVLENPGFNHFARTSNLHSRNSSYQDPLAPSHRLTKQGVAEMQFAGKVMTNIIRHSMGRQLDPNDDSATEESDTDDEEVVLPDERMMDIGGSSSDFAPYLPVENNPFIEAVKVEKQYEARRTSIDFSINECEYSLTKSLALRKHCKARKPLFQLEKPSTSTNTSVDADPRSTKRTQSSRTNLASTSTSLDVCRVSEMMAPPRRSSTDGDKEKLSNGETGENGPAAAPKSIKVETTESGSNQNQTDPPQEAINKTNGTDGANDRSAFIPTIKTMGSGGGSVLGVEFINNSDPNLSSSRCAAIKRPDKNRKVFQLGGIQNIFRDADRLPTVHCSCFGREELCALCLGRAKKKAQLNHVHMTFKEKLAILDETFHKTLSFPDDVPLEVLLASNAVGNHIPLVKPPSNIQQLIKARSHQFPPDLLETGSRPKKPRIYDIKPYVETPIRSPKKDGRYYEEASQSPRKRPPPRKSQSSFEKEELSEYPGKGLGWPNRERKDSARRTRNQEFDIDNIVIPYSMAATTRVEQLVYKPIETPRWRVLDYTEIFEANDKSDGELEDMSNATFLQRHNKCEAEEKKRFSQSLQKALNATRKTRRLDSTCRSESDPLSGLINDENSTHPLLSPDKVRGKDGATPLTTSINTTGDGAITPVADTSTVITEAMANQALKSLFKVGNRRRTISTSIKVEETTEEEPVPVVVREIVDPWPERQFPLEEEEYKEMQESMEQSLEESMDYSSHLNNLSHLDDPPLSPMFI